MRICRTRQYKGISRGRQRIRCRRIHKERLQPSRLQPFRMNHLRRCQVADSLLLQYGLHLKANHNLVADDHAAGLKDLVVGQTIILSVDGG